MRTLALITLTATLAMAAGLCDQEITTSSEEMTKEEFVKLGSLSMTQNDDHLTYLIDAEMVPSPLDIKLRFILARKKTEQLALYCLDGKDNTPIMIVKGNHSIFYDPIAGRLVIQNSAAVLFKFSDTEFGGGINTKPRNLIDINFRSYLDKFSSNAVITSDKSGQGYWFDGSNEKRFRCRAKVLPSSAIPLQYFELSDKPDEPPLVKFNRIDSDPIFKESFFESLLSPIEQGKLPRQNAVDQKTEKMNLSVLNFVMFRAAMADPGLRRSNPLASLQVDWDLLEEKDKKFSASLRQAFANELRDLGVEQ